MVGLKESMYLRECKSKQTRIRLLSYSKYIIQYIRIYIVRKYNGHIYYRGIPSVNFQSKLDDLSSFHPLLAGADLRFWGHQHTGLE